jgi:hypothetical protein
VPGSYRISGRGRKHAAGAFVVVACQHADLTSADAFNQTNTTSLSVRTRDTAV